MRYILLTMTLIIAFSSCNDSGIPITEKKFRTLDFTYLNVVGGNFFSLKFTDGDTVFVSQYVLHNPRSIKSSSYYALLTGRARAIVDSFINTVDFATLDTVYENGDIDGDVYQIYIEKDSLSKLVYVHNFWNPKELNEFKRWIINTKNNLPLIPFDSSITYRSHKGLLPTIPEN